MSGWDQLGKSFDTHWLPEIDLEHIICEKIYKNNHISINKAVKRENKQYLKKYVQLWSKDSKSVV